MIQFIFGALAAIGISELSKKRLPKMADGGSTYDYLSLNFGYALEGDLKKEYLEIIKLVLDIENISYREGIYKMYDNVQEYDRDLDSLIDYLIFIGEREYNDEYFEKAYSTISNLQSTLQYEVIDLSEKVSYSEDNYFLDYRYAKDTINALNEIRDKLKVFQQNMLKDKGKMAIGGIVPTSTNGEEFAKGGKITEKEKLQKELLRLQRELNSSRLRTYMEGDTSEEAMARRKERAEKLVRFNEILAKLNTL